MKKIRIRVTRGLGRSLGHLIEREHGDGKKIPKKENWIEVICVRNGRYKVVANNMTSKKERGLSFSEWTDDVINLDHEDRSDAAWIGMSEKLRWRNVIITPKKIIAPDIKKVRQALKHVVFCAWDIDDM